MTVSDTFFTIESAGDGDEWFVPTDMARGPWDPEAGHAFGSAPFR